MSDRHTRVSATATNPPMPQWTQDHVAYCLCVVRRALVQLGLDARGVDIHDAEDLTMDLVLKLLVIPDAFEQMRSAPWLMKVARRLIIDKLRSVTASRRAVNAGCSAQAFRSEAVMNDAATVVDQRIDKDAVVNQVTAYFSARERELFQFDWQQGGQAETDWVAAEMHIAPASVHVLRHRYKCKAKEALADTASM